MMMIIIINYQLQQIITLLYKKEPISLPPLKNEEIKDAIEKLEDVTRLRLLCDEIIPKPMKKNYVIGKFL